ncbi:STAS domain-containing protein [Humisphaera borealis]|uniref:STAS domain-containing protein n=1 Tax=Humisphaera borealis TaxID=2807512 RepID=A0A7M2WW26_9BACT|nr:STAS domain-containing protein [Humisphaera borealis]QOV89695.1 STAS domain-containing protein [Humisphaera borealis]
MPRSARGETTAMSVGTLSLVAKPGRFSHRDAEALCGQIRASRAPTVIVDFRETEDATTAAFAQLVLLRRELLREGRDLRLKGLRSRAASIWRISRLSMVLPLQ